MRDRRTAVVLLDPGSPFRAEAFEVAKDLGYDTVQAADLADAESFAETLAPRLVLTSRYYVDTQDVARRLAIPGRLVVVLEHGETAAARPVEQWVVLAVPPDEPGQLARNLHLLALARELGLPIHVEKQQLRGRLERKSFLQLADELRRLRFSGRVELPTGSVHIAGGTVVDARCRPTLGEKAFARLARQLSGAFTVQPGPVVVDRRIRAPTEDLIADGVAETLTVFPAPDTRIRKVEEYEGADLSPIQARLAEVAGQGQGTTLQNLLDTESERDGIVLEEIVQLHRAEALRIDQPANSVQIVVDSGADLPSELIRQLKLEVVPLTVRIGRERHLDREQLEPAALYTMMREGRPEIECEAPSKSDFVQVYRRLLPQQDVVCVHSSAELTPTKQTAFQAAEQVLAAPKMAGCERPTPRVKVLDTRQAGLAAGLLAIFGARMAARGKGADFIVQRLRRIGDRIVTLFAVGDPGFVAQTPNRRLTAPWRSRGETPILRVAEGELRVVASAEGAHGIESRLLEWLRDEIDATAPVYVGISHAGANTAARRLRELIRRDYDVLETIEGEIGPVVASRTGPGTVGAAMVVPEPDEIPLIAPLSELHAFHQKE